MQNKQNNKSKVENHELVTEPGKAKLVTVTLMSYLTKFEHRCTNAYSGTK